ncbi:hypothetical protein HGRIS_005360 [Hohenbuehelia grisea]|uniref:Uncharacterized protein n=1 Tax=Hohenbuehelia grisea TaxID=104357 RepID=A0ABR3JFB4_9AGAR
MLSWECHGRRYGAMINTSKQTICSSPSSFKCSEFYSYSLGGCRHHDNQTPYARSGTAHNYRNSKRAHSEAYRHTSAPSPPNLEPSLLSSAHENPNGTTRIHHCVLRYTSSLTHHSVYQYNLAAVIEPPHSVRFRRASRASAALPDVGLLQCPQAKSARNAVPLTGTTIQTNDEETYEWE